MRGRWIRERAATLVVAALLIATAGAFVWTERQKLQPPPFEVSDVTETFSPVCRCDRAAADIGLEFRRRTRLTLEIADEDGNVIRPLVSGVQERGPVVIRWNGRDANGNVVPEGTYRPRARIGGSAGSFCSRTGSSSTRQSRRRRSLVSSRRRSGRAGVGESSSTTS